MKDFNFFRFFKIWILSLLLYITVLMLILFISGQLTGELFAADFFLILTFIVMISSGIVGLTNVIYAIVKKNVPYIFVGLVTMFLAVVTFFVAVIISLSQIW